MKTSGFRKRRINGFDYPFSFEQIALWIVYPTLTTGFILLSTVVLDGFNRLLILILDTVLVAVVVYSWLIVSYLDPADNKVGTDTAPSKRGIPVLCLTVEQRNTARYCSTCNKQVLGLDHHCVWLNTCVGSRTYVHFFLLISACFIQMALQLVIGISFVAIYYNNDTEYRINSSFSGDSVATFYALSSLQILGSFLVFVLCGALLCFHVYLLLILKGTTYDYQLKNHSGSAYESDLEEQEMEKQRKATIAESEKALARQQWALKMQRGRHTTSASNIPNPLSPFRRFSGKESGKGGGTGTTTGGDVGNSSPAGASGKRSVHQIMVAAISAPIHRLSMSILARSNSTSMRRPNSNPDSNNGNGNGSVRQSIHGNGSIRISGGGGNGSVRIGRSGSVEGGMKQSGSSVKLIRGGGGGGSSNYGGSVRKMSFGGGGSCSNSGKLASVQLSASFIVMPSPAPQSQSQSPRSTTSSCKRIAMLPRFPSLDDLSKSSTSLAVAMFDNVVKTATTTTTTSEVSNERKEKTEKTAAATVVLLEEDIRRVLTNETEIFCYKQTTPTTVFANNGSIYSPHDDLMSFSHINSNTNNDNDNNTSITNDTSTMINSPDDNNIDNDITNDSDKSSNRSIMIKSFQNQNQSHNESGKFSNSYRNVSARDIDIENPAAMFSNASASMDKVMENFDNEDDVRVLCGMISPLLQYMYNSCAKSLFLCNYNNIKKVQNVNVLEKCSAEISYDRENESITHLMSSHDIVLILLENLLINCSRLNIPTTGDSGRRAWAPTMWAYAFQFDMEVSAVVEAIGGQTFSEKDDISREEREQCAVDFKAVPWMCCLSLI
eukprot:gene169-289_t